MSNEHKGNEFRPNFAASEPEPWMLRSWTIMLFGVVLSYDLAPYGPLFTALARLSDYIDLNTMTPGKAWLLRNIVTVLSCDNDAAQCTYSGHELINFDDGGVNEALRCPLTHGTRDDEHEKLNVFPVTFCSRVRAGLGGFPIPVSTGTVSDRAVVICDKVVA